MKNRHLYLLFPALIAFSFSCNDSDDNVPDPEPGQVTAVIDGDQYFSNIAQTSGVLTNIVDKTLSLTAIERVDAGEAAGILRLIFIEEDGDTTSCVPEGDYFTDSGAALRVVASYEIGNDFFGLTGVNASFQARITQCDPQNRRVSGTFSGVLQQGSNGPVLAISDGRFNQIPFSE
jgi:hypothetical protein